MYYLMIESTGEVDPRGFELLGGSTKRDDSSKIGFFGTGCKYATAVLLRKRLPLVVTSGMKKITFKTMEEDLRGAKFQRILLDIDGVSMSTSFTTDLGPKWELWMAMREFISNALDEGGYSMHITSHIDPKPGVSRVFIGVTPEAEGEITAIVDSLDTYFLSRNLTNTAKKLVHEPVGYFYKRGIRVKKLNNSLFSYDVPEVQINEEREADDYWCRNAVPDVLGACSAAEVRWWAKAVNNAYYEGKTCWEMEVNFAYSVAQYKVKWEEALRGTTMITKDIYLLMGGEVPKNSIMVTPSLFKALLDCKADIKTPASILTTGDADYLEVELQADWKKLLQSTIKPLMKAGMDLNRYTIKVFRHADTSYLGGADVKTDTILLSESLFKNYLDHPSLLSVTLIEEWAHLRSGHKDFTRGFQDFLVTEIHRLSKKSKR